MIPYKLISKKNPRDLTADPKFYAQSKSREVVELDALSKLISREGTVSRTDVYAVLIALIDVLIMELSAGRTVRLGKFGTFAISLSSEGAENKESFLVSLIKKARILFRPGSELKQMLNNLKYEKVA